LGGNAETSLFYQSDDKRRGGPVTGVPISFHPVLAHEQVSFLLIRRGSELGIGSWAGWLYLIGVMAMAIFACFSLKF
jgi:hypothetical protein